MTSTPGWWLRLTVLQWDIFIEGWENCTPGQIRMYSKWAHLTVVYQLERQRPVIFQSLWKYAMLVRLKLGFEPIQDRSGLKKRPQRVRSVLCLHSPILSIHPRGVHSALRPHAEHELACMQKERKDCAQKILSFGRLCSRSNFTSTSKTTNRDLFKASRPPGSIFWTNSHCLQRNSSRTLPSAADELDTFYILDAAVDVFLTSDI